MNYLEINTKESFLFHWCGKFEAPYADWVHLTRVLTDYELIVVTKGYLYIADDETKYTVAPGEYLLMPPTKKQYGYKPSFCSFYWIHFQCQREPKLYKKLPDLSCRSTQIETTILLPFSSALAAPDRIIVLMKQLQDSDRRYRSTVLNTYLASALLLELFYQSNLFQKQQTAGRQEQLYNDMLDYIKWHLCEPLKISELADYFGYNVKYISSLFHKLSGIPLKQYMQQEKMDHAKAALSDTNQTISQIAYSIGFQDTHHFTNSFKKATGLSPTEYRTSYSKRSLYYE